MESSDFQLVMMKKLFVNRSTIKLSLFITAIVGLSLWVGNQPSSIQSDKPSVPITTSTTTPTNQIKLGQPQVYWLQSKQNKLTLVAKSLPLSTSASTSQQVLTTAMQKLLTAQPSDNLSSTIPKGTKLRSLQVKSDGVHIDLSREFRAGGGSKSMIYRVAQTIYTATSLDPNQKVFLSVEGQSIDRAHPLGGEGLILRQPITRSQFNTDFPLNP
jgi:spore germination protein GerM